MDEDHARQFSQEIHATIVDWVLRVRAASAQMPGRTAVIQEIVTHVAMHMGEVRRGRPVPVRWLKVYKDACRHHGVEPGVMLGDKKWVVTVDNHLKNSSP